MLYDARKPCAPKAASQVKSTDTIESTGQRLKNEMISKLDNKGLELPHESYVAVVQVGKYVFLAVMLPVYLCCYGIPRWFAVNALAPLFEGIKNQAVNVGRHIVEISKHVNDLMKGLLDQLVGDALRMAKERGKNLWRHASKRFSRISKKVAGFSNAITSRLGKIKGGIGDASKKVMERAHYQSKSTNEWIARKSVSIGKKVGAKALNYFQRFDQAFLTPFIKIITAPFRAIMIALRVVKKHVVKISNRIRRRLEKMYRPVARLITVIVRYLLQKTKVYYQRLAEAFEKKIRKLATVLKAVKNALLKPVARLLNRYKVLRPFFRFAKKGFMLSFSACKATIKFAGKILPKKAEKKEGKSSSLFNFFSLLKDAMKRFFNPFTNGVSKVKSAIFTIYKFVGRLSRLLLRLFKVFMRFAGRCLVAVFKAIAFITKRVAFVVHVVIAVLWLSGTHGFQLARQISDPLKS